MPFKLTASQHAELPEDEQSNYVQPEGADFYIPKEAHEYAEERAAVVHKTVKALREELKAAAKPEDVATLQREIALRDAAEAAGANRYARSFFADRVTTDDDGNYVLKGDNGKIMRDDKEQPLPLADALAHIRDSGDHATLFAARATSGGGGAPRKTGPEPRVRQPMGEDERRNFLREQMAKGKNMRDAIKALEAMPA